MSAAPAPARIRAARPYDAAALLELKHQLDRETAFMMYEPDERDSPVRDLAAELASLGRSANSVVLLAELGDQLIGYVQLTGGSLRRSRATAYGQFIDELTMATLLPDPSAPPATPLSLAPPPARTCHPFEVVPGTSARTGRPVRSLCATGYVLAYPVCHRPRNRGPEPRHFLTTRHTAPSRLAARPACAPPVRVPLGAGRPVGRLMKTVKESRHPFVYVFLMAAQ